MWNRLISMVLLCGGMTALVLTQGEARSQGKGGGGGPGKSPGHAAPDAPKPANTGPAMTRPAPPQNKPAPAPTPAPSANKPAPAPPQNRPAPSPQNKANGGPPPVNKGPVNKGPGNVGKEIPGKGNPGPITKGPVNPGPGNQGGPVQRPNTSNNMAKKPNGGFERPTPINNNPPRPNGGGGIAGKNDQPKIGSGNLPGQSGRPNIAGRPGTGGESSDQLNDFLGGGNRPGPDRDRPKLPNGGENDTKFGKGDLPKFNKEDSKVVGKGDLPKFNKDESKGVEKGNLPNNLPNIGDRKNSPEITVGNVNVGNSVDYSKNQQAWVSNHHNTGNQVRLNSANRYEGAYNNGHYRRNVVGGYPYTNGWADRGAYYGWNPVSYAAVGSFVGATWANTQPRYYAYGEGGNVYYEDNLVYVDGQPSGTAAEYAQQILALLAKAPAQVQPTEEWLPLGAYAFTREGVNDSQAMVELAVNKKGVIAGSYFNEATGVSRPLKGMIDQNTQRVAIGFADDKNTDLVLETGINNLTKDEAPGLLHQGRERSTPVLLVRLQAPGNNGNK